MGLQRVCSPGRTYKMNFHLELSIESCQDCGISYAYNLAYAVVCFPSETNIPERLESENINTIFYMLERSPWPLFALNTFLLAILPQSIRLL